MDLFPDSDIQETQEWIESLNSVIETEGTERAHFLIEMLIDQARRSGSNLPYNATFSQLLLYMMLALIIFFEQLIKILVGI